MTDTPTALLPCPFCGEPAEYDSQRWLPPHRPNFKSVTGHAITCSACEAEVGLFECYEDAIAAWNKRTQPADTQADMAERARGRVTAFVQSEREAAAAEARRALQDVMRYYPTSQDAFPTHAVLCGLASPPAPQEETR